jgi:hypothetical protein
MPPLAALCPPATVIDKTRYSAFAELRLIEHLRQRKADALIVSGSETDVSVLDAVDIGYRVIVVRDAVCSSSDEGHDMLMQLYHTRYTEQIETADAAAILADVLRIDPPHWDEPAIEPQVTLGKRCARLDLRQPPDRARFERLISEADLFIHGYRPKALGALGYERTFAPRSIRISSTSASTPMVGRARGETVAARQSRPDVDRHCCRGQGVARRRQADPAAGAGARSRDRLSHGGGGRSWPCAAPK